MVEIIKVEKCDCVYEGKVWYYNNGTKQTDCGRCGRRWREEKGRQERLERLETYRKQKKQSKYSRIELQEMSKEFAERHDEDITDEDIIEFETYTKGYPKTNADILYELALFLQRRFGAMEWWWNLAWDDKAPSYITKGEDMILYQRFQQIKEDLEL